MTDTRPRAYATQLLKDLRPFCTERLDAMEVPKELRPMVMRHVTNWVSLSLNRRKVK
jgi:hypothetical protein